ncbi:MAG: diacylglycerol kinase family lipid kinase [Anaerolineaceae bacterium]|nr:diacylglycerol kinase family lipid kinase [Anaerolineaceae bacterium]
MHKYCLIVNPLAGKGSALKAIPEIESLLNGLGLDYDIILTEYPGHAIQLAKDAGSNGYQTVVAVGGDGTANEVINGLMQDVEAGNLSANLAVLPVGRGNDFSFGMGVPHDLEEACKALAEAKTRRIDVGLVKGGDYPDGRYFGNGVGIGFDTVVGFEAAKLPNFISGIPAYLIAAVKTIFLYFRAPLLRVELDNEVIEQTCLLVSLMNGRRMGGSFMFAPESEQDDGLLNLCIVEGVTRGEVLKIFPKVMSGTQGEHPAVKMPLSQKVKITALSGSLPVHADGETICEAGSALEVTILKQQIPMICG